MMKLKRVRELINQYNAYNEYTIHHWHWIFLNCLNLYSRPGPNTNKKEWDKLIPLCRTRLYGTFFVNPKLETNNEIIKRHKRIVEIEQKMDSKQLQIEAILEIDNEYCCTLLSYDKKYSNIFINGAILSLYKLKRKLNG